MSFPTTTSVINRKVNINNRQHFRSDPLDLVSHTLPSLSTAKTVLTSEYSVEANVVVIASCIPTLQPLLEFLTGKRSLTSSNRNTDDKKTNNGYNSGSYGVGKRSLPRKDNIGFTTVESEESILRESQLEGANAHPLTQIRRTDNVTVNYETRNGGYGKDGTSW